MPKLYIATDQFDAIFDPFRMDRKGTPASADEVRGLPPLANGMLCPAKYRRTQLQCAIFVLGNLVGSTMRHELGHSLGLASPLTDDSHDLGDLPNRLMEAGSDRPFEERAEILGQGPARFCLTEFMYMKKILPAPAATDPKIDRPSCD